MKCVCADLMGQHRRRGRGRRRNSLLDFSEDLQGNDYEVRRTITRARDSSCDSSCDHPQMINSHLHLSIFLNHEENNLSSARVSGSSGVWGASRCRRVQEVDSEGNPAVSHQILPVIQQRREHAVSRSSWSDPELSVCWCNVGESSSLIPADWWIDWLIDWQVSDMFLRLHWWGEAEDVAVFPWLPRPVYWSMVKGNCSHTRPSCSPNVWLPETDDSSVHDVCDRLHTNPINSWLYVPPLPQQDNTTCPICRVNLADGDSLAPPTLWPLCCYCFLL